MNWKTFSQIVQEQIDYLAGVASPLTDVNIGSATRSLLEAVALVLAELHYLGEQLLSRFFVVTATGQWLDMRASELGLTRVQASPTLRLLTITHGATAPLSTPAVTIPVGQQFQTLPGAAVQVTYQVTQQTILPAGSATVDVPVVSTTTGAATALPDATVLRQQGTALAYIDSVVTGAVTTAGTDRESDDSLRARVLDRLRNPQGPGSAADLIHWALDAPDGHVAVASVVRLPRGDGSADVLILGAGNSIPTGDEIAAVQAYINDRVAIAADILVRAPTTRSVDVNVTVTAGSGFDAATVRANVATAIATYLNGLAIEQDALIGGVANAVWDTSGVGGPNNSDGGNYSGLVMRVSPAAFAASDIAIGAGDKAIAGVITVS